MLRLFIQLRVGHKISTFFSGNKMNEKFFTFLLFCKNNFAVLQKRVVHGLTVKLFEPSTTGDHDLSFKI